MSTLLIKNADLVATMDSERREIPDGAIYVEDNVIKQVGETDSLPAEADVVINAAGTVVIPGLVNCHHHLYQTLTRTTGTAGGMALFDWLRTLYVIWANMDSEAVYVSAKVALAELALSGATTVADHLYLFPNGSKLDDEIRAAKEIGVRFQPTRGSMSLGKSKGGLPPDDVCECEEDIIKETQRLIETFHDPEPYSMCRVDVAPCSPFSVTPDLMREAVSLARSYGVNLHTHLAETLDEERFCLERFGKRPVGYAEELGWLGPDVWFAHAVHLNDAEIDLLAETGTGVCHCPSSNMILASGIAPIRQMRDRGVRVGIGVDGSASNDGNNLLAEARQAMLLQRVGWPGFESRADRMSAREALEIATIGGASVLNRDDIGSLEPGKAADFVAYRVDDLEHAGSQQDRLASLVTCAPTRAWLSVINGNIVVERGKLQTVDIEPVVRKHNAISQRIHGKS